MATKKRPRRNAGQPTRWVRLPGAPETWVELWSGRPVAIASKRSLGLDSLADVRALAREQLHRAYGGRYNVSAWGPKNQEGIVKAVVTNAPRRNPSPKVYIRLRVRPSVMETSGHPWPEVQRRLKRAVHRSYPEAFIDVDKYQNKHFDFDMDSWELLAPGKLGPLPMEQEASIRNHVEDIINDLVNKGQL